MELQVIRHKTVEDFFRSFCSESEVASYSYQLQRMFESGAAKEGDYFVVKDGNVPILHVEVYRNNTRRIWEREPVISSLYKNDKNLISEALKLVFDFIDDEIYYSGKFDKLEIMVSDPSDYSEIMIALCKEYGYFEFEKLFEYEIKHSDEKTSYTGNNKFKNFTDFDPEFRFSLIGSKDYLSSVLNYDKQEKIYQDYLDDSYLSESLWKVIFNGEKVSGFFMPSFTSGLKTNLRLINYYFEKDVEKSILSDVVAEMGIIASDNNSKNLEFPVRQNDLLFREVVESVGGEQKNIFRRFIKNDHI